MPNQIYLPLKEAAKKHNVEEEVLIQLIAAGMIEAVEENGEIVVTVDKNGNGDNEPQTKDEIIAAKFAHLKGQSITVTEAAQNYNLHRDTVLEWVKREYIKVLKPGYRMKLDNADVAYCAYVYQQKKAEYGNHIAGAKIFDGDGNPYQVKYPDLSSQRRGLT